MAKRDSDRDRRLAEALRENLRRRKAQAREAKGGERSGRGGEGPLHQPAAGPPPRSGED